MELKSGMLLEPFLHLLSMVDTHIVTDDVDESNERRGFLVDVLKKRDEFLLPFSAEVLTDDFAGSGIESGKKVQGSISFVLMLNQVGLVPGFCRFGGTVPGPWLQGCLLIHREDDLMGKKGTGVEIDDVGNAFVECLIPWVFGREPHVIAPGF